LKIPQFVARPASSAWLATDEVLHDRMKTAVTGTGPDGGPVFNAALVDLPRHHGAVPRACRPCRPETKGKVERPFSHIRQDFHLGRSFRDLDDLNAFADWLDTVASVRAHGTTGRAGRLAKQSLGHDPPHRACKTMRIILFPFGKSANALFSNPRCHSPRWPSGNCYTSFASFNLAFPTGNRATIGVNYRRKASESTGTHAHAPYSGTAPPLVSRQARASIRGALSCQGPAISIPSAFLTQAAARAHGG